MKKVIIRVTLVLTGLALLVALLPSVMRWQFGVALRWHDAAEYRECREEFNIIKDYVQSEYYDGETRRYFAVGGDTVYDGMNGEYVQWPAEIMEAIRVANREGFPQQESSLDVIRVERDRITFSGECKRYHLVYMVKGWPDGAYVRVIGKGWYHVIY